MSLIRGQVLFKIPSIMLTLPTIEKMWESQDKLLLTIIPDLFLGERAVKLHYPDDSQ